MLPRWIKIPEKGNEQKVIQRIQRFLPCKNIKIQDNCDQINEFTTCHPIGSKFLCIEWDEPLLSYIETVEKIIHEEHLNGP